ncbi:MAG: hypothetical protein H6581_10285 [Bacteroidia bacterium]|nr:hypothetical protein [Bacteroidia bacterium]
MEPEKGSKENPLELKKEEMQSVLPFQVANEGMPEKNPKKEEKSGGPGFFSPVEEEREEPKKEKSGPENSGRSTPFGNMLPENSEKPLPHTQKKPNQERVHFDPENPLPAAEQESASPDLEKSHPLITYPEKENPPQNLLQADPSDPDLSPEEKLAALWERYSAGQMGVQALASALVPFASTQPEPIIEMIRKLPENEREALCKTMVGLADDRTLSGFALPLLQKMAGELGGFFNPAHWEENWTLASRVNALLMEINARRRADSEKST